MKSKLLFGMLVAALVAIAGIWSPARSEAAVEDLSYTQSCQPDGSLSVTFSWPDVNIYVVQQWLDLSLSDNGWQGGSFLSNGPLAAAQQSVTWRGLMQNATHYVRVNQWMPAGNWEASPTFYFTTSTCPGGPPQVIVITGPGGGSISTADVERKQIDAPIDDVKIGPSAQAGFAVQARVGLPSGCAKAGGYQVTQQDNVINVHIFDTLPVVAIPCTSPPPDYTVTVDLPAMTPGKPYEIHVNDKVINFVIP